MVIAIILHCYNKNKSSHIEALYMMFWKPNERHNNARDRLTAHHINIIEQQTIVPDNSLIYNEENFANMYI